MNRSTGLPPEGKRGKQLSSFDRLLARFFTGTHRAILKLTGGRVMSTMGGNKLGILTTIGRKSGQPRSHPVITIPDGENRLVVATNAGAANHPSWVRNALANPEVELTIDGHTRKMRAQLLSSDEKKQLWPQLVQSYRLYDTMQNKTDRDIPVVRLTPTR
ncbi:nitroreductase family deazaflavin-dependent oxidoreductase [Lentzea nigeriaca]|uniref:nitroreductase family deazaflavin-dependent oxidoreductase n=1 Tax=Lentzea nigeriaca TaxID=1128665 RepID=UPI00195AC193|nr:nitroreductase family deazaflavin-dependent oxidoreductase [Lentzea nigeriaca]MBM7856344.1 deazaflavin-dependent oxidoreductase (nitroreductase family) [Lentzea nigeriaca]